jgi:predicted small secreted protein
MARVNVEVAAMKLARIGWATLSFAGLMMSAGCNTVEGVGRDVERLGDAIEDEASETRREQRRND